MWHSFRGYPSSWALLDYLLVTVLFGWVCSRWEPFRRSAYMAKREQVLKPEDKKFFAALIKPKAYNSHLESFKTAEKNTGAVFRALPVYRVRVFDI